MRAGLAALCGLLLAGCGEEMTPEERELADRQAIAAVERANQALPPPVAAVPEPISAADIERFDMLGAGCSYAPGTSLATRVIAREADAFVKIDGEIQRMAADPGARELPLRTRSLYSGRSHSLRLRIIEPAAEAAEAAEADPGNLEGSVSLRDVHGRVIYEGTGPVRCEASLSAGA